MIEFLPSYKWKHNTVEFDIHDGKRIPSWTDRVLYNSQNMPIFAPIKYELDEETIFSDHRPVYLIVNCGLRKLNLEMLKESFRV